MINTSPNTNTNDTNINYKVQVARRASKLNRLAQRSYLMLYRIKLMRSLEKLLSRTSTKRVTSTGTIARKY
jgi:hypothetical protein